MSRLRCVGDWTRNQPNQDAGWVNAAATAGAVFDGLAGHAESEKASEICRQVTALAGAQADRLGARWPSTVASLCRAAVLNGRSAQRQRAGKLLAAPMTCAAVFAWAGRQAASVAWAGDCRAYHVNADGHAAMITRDHDEVSRWVQEGKIGRLRADAIIRALEDVETKSDAFRAGGPLAKKAFQKRHVMHSEIAVGEISTVTVPFAVGDLLVLTSDGVHDNLTGSSLREICAAHRDRPDDLAGELVEQARLRATKGQGRAHPDDMTCVVLG